MNFYVLERRNPISQYDDSCCYLSNDMDKVITWILDNKDFEPKDTNWWWAVIKMELDNPDGGSLYKIFDIDGNELENAPIFTPILTNKENFLKLVSPEKCDTMDRVKDRILRRPEIRKQQQEEITKIIAENWVTCNDCNWEGDIGECDWDSEPDAFSGNDRKYPICPKCEGGIE